MKGVVNQDGGRPESSGPANGSNRNTSMWLWVGAGCLFLAMAMSMQSPPSARYEQLAFTDFLADVETGRVNDVTIQGQVIVGQYETSGAFRSYVPAGTDVVETRRQNDVRVNAVSEP